MGRAAPRSFALFGLAFALAFAGCATPPPAHWASGGASVDIPSARWAAPGMNVDLQPDGVVSVGGERLFHLDGHGRIEDDEGRPYALLEADGRLVRSGERFLGHVDDKGATTADGQPLFALSAAGEVVRTAADGEHHDGSWTGGCSGSPSAHRTCLLVTTIVTFELERIRERQAQAEYRKNSNRAPRR